MFSNSAGFEFLFSCFVLPCQMINILNQQELSLVVPKSPLKPRNFVIKPGTVMFLSGLGRIDYNKVRIRANQAKFLNNQVLLNCFCYFVVFVASSDICSNNKIMFIVLVQCSYCVLFILIGKQCNILYCLCL